MSEKYYTQGYQSSANSAGYTSADQVRKLQSDLNKKGASLTVDGLWGPKTDSAYKQYSKSASAVSKPSGSEDYLSALNDLLNEKKNAIYSNPYAKELLTLIAPRKDDDYRREAEAALSGDVNRQLAALAQQMDETNMEYDKTRSDLQARAAEDRKSLAADYAQAKGDVETAALRRGMGRSSYLTDNLTYLGRQQADALASVNSDLAKDLTELTQAQQLAQKHYQQTVQRLQEDLAEDMAAYEAALREKDRERALSAYETLMNSYELFRRYREDDILSITTLLYEASLAREQAAAQQAAASAKAASKSSSSTAKSTAAKTPAKTTTTTSTKSVWDPYLYMNHPGSDPNML